MKSVNIMHISDAHIQKKDEREIEEIVKKLIADAKKVQTEKGIKIDLVCFTGDLIQRGDKAIEDEKQWELAMNILVNPLLDALGLSFDKFIFTPGNHEVDITRIDRILEKGLERKTLEDINEVFQYFVDSYRGRLSYLYDIVKNQHTDVFLDKLGYVYKKQINELNIGIACVDSAWRSTGKGCTERGHLYVCTSQIRDLYYQIEDCEIKICMMHHPLDWLEDCETKEVERELSKFDVVLRGHVHEEDLNQMIRNNLKTIYATAGKLYPLDYSEGRAKDGYNGYSILNINYETGKCNIYVRSYYAQHRKEFDIGLNICQNGEESYDICSKDSGWELEYDVVKGISNYFHNMSEKYALIREVDAHSPQSEVQILVEPVLSEKSEYVKENTDNKIDNEISIQRIFNSDEDIILIGKKESGKTTILQQIALKYIEDYENKKVIPIYINMKYLPKGNKKILNAAIRFVSEYTLEETAISKQQIKQLIEDRKVVFLIDNVKSNNSNHTIWLTEFISNNTGNRFVLTTEEEFFHSLDVKDIPEYGKEFKEVYIQYMGKTQIRAMVTQWAKGKVGDIDINETVNRIDSYCNQINFAKTPFNIAVFMVLWDNDNNFIPVNEGIVMETFLETVLEKLSPKESYRGSYNFKLKQHFLSHLAYKMYEKDEYFFTYEEFVEIVNEYHLRKGYNHTESQFGTIFFAKNILSYSEDCIVFSRTSFMEYFLALYAVNNKFFLDEITSPGKRMNFRNEICFYSGLTQDCTEVLENMSDAIMDTIVDFLELVDELNEKQQESVFKFDKEEFLDEIQKNRPSQEELDALEDKHKTYKERRPTEICKKDVVEDEAEDFYALLKMYGSIIKNAELLDNKDKVIHFENYMYGMIILYAMIIKLFEYIMDDMKLEELSDKDKELLNVHTEEEISKMKSEMLDISKLMFPIAIQNLILENVGTPKLEAAINELIKIKSDKPFEKFMLTFLKCDLKIGNLKSILKDYIRKENSKGILNSIYMKLTFYYKTRFFGINPKIDRELLELLNDIHIKLDPKFITKHQPKSFALPYLKKELDSKQF